MADPIKSPPPAYDDAVDQAQGGDEKLEFEGAKQATAKEHALTLGQALKAYPKAIMWSLLLSSAVIMEGYDTILVHADHDSKH